MNRETTRYAHLSQRRLRTLRLLAQAYRESQPAFVALDLNRMHELIAHQENLCAELDFLQRQLAAVPQPREEEAAGLPELSEIEATRREVRRLNQVHCAMLRRARRSTNVLLNFLARYAATYPPPGTAEMLT